MKEYIKIHEKDNVLVAIKEIQKGTVISIDNMEITALEDIPAGHKMAIFDIAAGDGVIKYGSCIGNAQSDIKAGSWGHTHNVKTALGDLLEYTYSPVDTTLLPMEEETFMGYRRKDGKVGIRNEVWIIPTVGCVNAIGSAMAKAARAKYNSEDIIAFEHPYGCSQMGEDEDNTRKILADLIHHPNAGAVLVLGLGCENSNIDVLKPYIGDYDEERVRFLICQEVEDEMEIGEKIIDELVSYVSSFEREKIGVSELIIGLKCGGSDGFSGITANPVVGKFSDLVVSQGGTTIAAVKGVLSYAQPVS